MKERTRTVYEAFDGAAFDTAAECAKYERENSWRRLIGLSEAEVSEAIATGLGDIAETIKTVGYQIAKIGAKGGGRSTKLVIEPDELPQPVGREPMIAVEAEEVVRR